MLSSSFPRKKEKRFRVLFLSITRRIFSFRRFGNPVAWKKTGGLWLRGSATEFSPNAAGISPPLDPSAAVFDSSMPIHKSVERVHAPRRIQPCRNMCLRVHANIILLASCVPPQSKNVSFVREPLDRGVRTTASGIHGSAFRLLGAGAHGYRVYVHGDGLPHLPVGLFLHLPRGAKDRRPTADADAPVSHFVPFANTQ